MCEESNKELVFTGIRFRPDLILVDSATVDTADWFRTIVPKLPGWKETELSTCAESVMQGAHMVMVYFPKAALIETEQLLRLLIT